MMLLGCGGGRVLWRKREPHPGSKWARNRCARIGKIRETLRRNFHSGLEMRVRSETQVRGNDWSEKLRADIWRGKGVAQGLESDEKERRREDQIPEELMMPKGLEERK